MSLHVEEWGRGRALVLVHGFGGNRFTWRHWLPRLSEGHRVLLVDLKGHGASPKPLDGRYSPFDQARLLSEVIRDREIVDATLVGHSLGGGIVLASALELLDDASRRVDSLVLISATTQPQEIPRYIGWARKPILGQVFLRLVPPRTLMRWALRSIVHDPSMVTQDQIEAYAEPFEAWRDRKVLLQASRQIVPEDAESVVERYGSFPRPVLLLWGRSDAVVPVAMGRELEERLPDARLVVLDECGHLPQEERPGASLVPVLEFIAKRDGAPGPGAAESGSPAR